MLQHQPACPYTASHSWHARRSCVTFHLTSRDVTLNKLIQCDSSSSCTAVV